MSRVVYENDLFRIVRQGREIKGNVEMTPEVIDHVTRVLLGNRTPSRSTLHLPREALESVGVSDASELELSIRDGAIVLTPRGQSDQ